MKMICLFVFFFISFISKCQNGLYIKDSYLGGQSFITINSNNTYDYVWFREWDVGNINDTIIHSGTWEKKGDTLIFNSFKTTDNYEDINVKEEIIKSDSTVIIITSDNSDFFWYFAPTQIQINDKLYFLSKVNKQNLVKIVLPFLKIKYIIINGYPVYKPQKEKSNYFHITIKELINSKKSYPSGTYFIDQEFFIKGDTLYELFYGDIQITYIKSK